MPFINSLSEPVRVSLYDNLQENLKIAGRRTYIIRSMVIAEHNMGTSWEWGIGEALRSIVEEINSEYCEENLTGMLLYYPQYFCHVTEGSEDVLMRCIQLLLSKYGTQLIKIKFLAPFHHVYKRLLNGWTAITAKPPRLLQKLEAENLQETFQHVSLCVRKLHSLCIQVQMEKDVKQMSDDQTVLISVASSTTIDGTNAGSSSNITGMSSGLSRSLSTATVDTTLAEGKSKWKAILPEYRLLEFLLESPYISDLRERMSFVSTVPPLFEDMTWPVGYSIEPDIYSVPPDPATDLPRREITK